MVTTTSRVVPPTRRRLLAVPVTTPLSARLPTPTSVALLVLLAALVGAVATQRWTFLDLTVYRYGGRTVLEQLPVYAAGEPGSGLLFTYPPFAALLLSTLALVPLPVAAAAVTAAGVGGLAVTLHSVARESGRRLAGPVLVMATLGALLLEPVRETLLFGQVNLVLMGLVTYDLLVLRGRWSGVLVGVAAGIKLTPLVFVVLLVAVGRPADACRAVSAFAASVLVGVVLLPRDAADFWGRAVWDSGRVGGAEYVRNQALSGVLARLLGHDAPTLLWLAVAGTAGLVCLALAAWWWRRGARDVGLVFAAGVVLLCSPISWDHHWVWVAPLLVVLASRAPRWTAYAVAAGLVVGVRHLVPSTRGVELTWTPLQQVWGNAYAWLALGLVAWSAVLVARTEVSQRRARARSGASSSPPSKTRSTVSSRGLGDVVVVTRSAVSRSSAASTQASKAGPAGTPSAISTAATSSAAASQP